MLQKVRENNNYMRLSRMGSRYPSRLSFSRSMLRRLINDNWEIHKSKFDLDKYEAKFPDSDNGKIFNHLQNIWNS